MTNFNKPTTIQEPTFSDVSGGSVSLSFSFFVNIFYVRLLTPVDDVVQQLRTKPISFRRILLHRAPVAKRVFVLFIRV